MTFKFYDILGVPKEASQDEIKRAYRKAAITNHPDKGGDPEKFKEVSNAYQILSDEEKRRRYDQVGDEGFDNNGGMNEGFGGMNPHDIFEQFFRGHGGGGGFPFHFDFGFGDGGMHRGATKKKDHVHTISISMADAYHGTQKTLRIGMKKACNSCKRQCYTCQGRGSITDMRRMGFMTQMITRPCDACSGAGATSKGCNSCNHQGHTMEEKRIEVKISPGVQTGQRYVFEGMGEQAASENEVSGDLIIEVHVQPDMKFQRQGNDLIHSVKLTLAESIIGKVITIPHYAGDIVVNLEEFGIIQPQKTYIINGKGMPGGNLIIAFQIDYTKTVLTSDERQSLRNAFKEVGML